MCIRDRARNEIGNLNKVKREQEANELVLVKMIQKKDAKGKKAKKESESEKEQEVIKEERKKIYEQVSSGFKEAMKLVKGKTEEEMLDIIHNLTSSNNTLKNQNQRLLESRDLMTEISKRLSTSNTPKVPIF